MMSANWSVVLRRNLQIEDNILSSICKFLLSKLVSGVEEELTNRRQDVVDLAEHVEDEVADLGDAIKNWVESIEPGERNSSGSINITLPDGKVIQIGNYSSYVKVTKLEDEDDDDTLVEDIPIIQ